MDKKILRSLPIQKADASDISLAKAIPLKKTEDRYDPVKRQYVKELVPSIKYLVRVRTDKKFLITYAFKTDDLKKGIPDPFFVTFFDRKSKEDLSLRKSEKGYKWSTASFEREMVCPMFPVPDEQKAVMDYFGNDGSGPEAKIRIYQKAFRDAKLNVRHKKETDEIDTVMKRIGPAPKGLEKWTYSKVLKPAFIYENFYEGNKKAKKIRVSCTACGKSGIMDKDKNLRHRREYRCPFCKAQVEGVSAGKIPSGWTKKDAKVAVLQRLDDSTFVWRYFWTYEVTYVKGIFREKNRLLEEGRDIVELDANGSATYTRYEKMNRKGSYRWWPSPDNGCRLRWSSLIPPSGMERYAYDSFAYPPSIKKALSNDERFKYFPLELQVKNRLDGFYEFALESYCFFPGIEKLIKVGLYNISASLLRRESSEINEKGNSILEILKLKNRNELNLLKKFDSLKVLSYLQSAIENGYALSEEDIILRDAFDSAYRNVGDSLNIIHNAKIDTKKFYHYLMRSCNLTGIGANEYKHIQFIRDYADYIKDLNFLEIPVTMKNAYPSDLGKTHEAIRLQVKAKEKLIELGRLKRLNLQIEKAAKRIEKKLAKAGFTKGSASGTYLLNGNDSLCITLPHSKSDLSVEGSQLNHCVGSAGYDMRIVDGQSLIIFVRKTSAPEKAYYTMEYDLSTKKIIQCRTMGDGSFDSLTPESFEAKNAIYRSMKTLTGGVGLNAKNREKLKELVKYNHLPSSDKKLAILLIDEIAKSSKGADSLSYEDKQDLKKLHIDRDDYVEKASAITDKGFDKALAILKKATSGRNAVLSFSKKLEKALSKVA